MGTTFTFTFRFKVSKKNQLHNGLHKEDQKLTDLTGYKILLVEDNVMNQRVAKYTIEKWGAKVTIADSGFKALEFLATEKFDLVLMDIQMPEMSGLQATYKIRKDLKLLTPIVAMTASVMQGERENCMKAGMNDYISKPFNPMELNQKIYNIIHQKQHIKQKRITNIDYLRAAVGNDWSAVKEILDLYLSKSPILLENIATCIAEGNYGDVIPHVHNLKNSVGVLGADQLFHLLDTIEFGLNNDKPTVEMQAMIEQMNALVKLSLDEVTKEFKASK
jgi:CheY-like chemotaxis protein